MKFITIKDADFLEVFFGDSSDCYVDEPELGVFLRKDENTDDVKSIRIIGFKKRAEVLIGRFLYF
jgi:hypothetical protein